MKKLLLTLLVAVISVLSVSARDEYVRNGNLLPTAAKTCLKNNFDAKVNLVKIDRDFGRISDYEVILTDGTEVKFDSKGNWEDVEVAESKSVPKAFVLAPIAAYVKKFQPGARIVGIEKHRRGYDLELSNGVEMKFDRQGNFKSYDD